MKSHFRIFVILFCMMPLLTSCAAKPHGKETTAPIDITSPITVAMTQESTSAPETTSAETTVWDYRFPYYLPEEEWEGLETSAYDNPDPAFVSYVQRHPQGTPDPDYVKQGTVPYVTVKTERAQYSLSQDEGIKIMVSYEKAENGAEQKEKIGVHYIYNLERWNGTGWERLLYVTNKLYWDRVYAYSILYPGEMLEEDMGFGSCATLLTPGQYRAVVYVSNTICYAEFELTE